MQIGLTELPESITKLTSLTVLDLNNNQLTQLPESITKLTSLTRLDLSSNQLTELPESIIKLTSLNMLHLSNNQLAELPKSIIQIASLTELYLMNNGLTQLPESITKLTNLTALDLDGNRLTQLPESIIKLTKLTTLDLRNNPLPIPPEIVEAWTNAPRILDYLRQLQQSPDANRPVNEAKMILVGEAKNGKTSLVRRLIWDEFDPQEKKTDGIDIHRWDLDGIRCAVDPGNQESNPRTVRLNVWDLGGQEIYHATHQFFLTERTLYLIVLSARLTDEQNRLHYWLKTVRALGKDAPILIVQNHYEDNPEQLDRKTLTRTYPTIHDFIHTSCLDPSPKGIDALKDAIRNEIGKMRHVADLLPPSYFAVKESLEEETKQRDFVDGDEYEAICKDAKVTDPMERKDILKLLHALGTVLSFQDDFRLRDTNVLNPEWVTEGVYSVLDDPRMKAAGDGILRMDTLSAILANAQKYYPTSKHRFIIEMMEKFELCFERPYKKGEYLIPELLTPSEPDDIGDFSDSLCFELQYDFLPRSILPRFIVRTGDLLQPYRWRNGVVIEENRNRAVIRGDIEANKVTISVTGNETTRRDLLSVVRAHFAQIHQTPETLMVIEQIPLADYPQADPVPYTFLRELEDDRVEEFRWPGVPAKLSVSQMLSGIERTRRSDDSKEKPKGEDIVTAKPTPPVAVPVNHNDLLKRTRLLSLAQDNGRYLHELMEKVKIDRVVPFVGAGMTVSFKMPLWVPALNEIYRRAYSSLKPEDAMAYGSTMGRSDLEGAAQVLWDALGERWFNDQIQSLFSKHKLPKTITGAISLLPQVAPGPVLTTNFDTALEKVYADAGDPFSLERTVLGAYRADSVLQHWDEGRRFLLKLHGDAEESAGRVLTKEQYDHAYSKASKLPELLRALFGSRRPLLFLGCSLQSDRTLTELENAGLHQSNSYHFALLEMPATEPERMKRQTELVGRYGIQPIWFKPGDFPAIKRVLQALADARAAKP